MTTFALGYSRFSPRPGASECESCNFQDQSIAEHCTRQAYILRDNYSDPEASGHDEDRDGLREAIAALQPGWVLVVYHQDRLARGLLLVAIEDDVAKRGARIEYVVGVNGSDPEAEMARHILAVVSGYQRKLLAARTKWAVRKHQANGRRMTRPDRLPFGVMVDTRGPKNKKSGKPDRVVPNPEEAAIIERMRLWQAEGAKPTEIAQRLMAEKVLFRGGRVWHASTVARILERPIPSQPPSPA